MSRKKKRKHHIPSMPKPSVAFDTKKDYSEFLISKLSELAQEMLDARRKCLAVHGSGDIRAAGNEVEIACREKLAERLRRKYYVTHGHIIDSEWKNSGQLDFMVADASSAPIILTTGDGTEYLPYEAVYAVGEIKSTFSIQGLLDFSNKLKYIAENLHRETVAGDEFSLGGQIIKDPGRKKEAHISRNPLFSFFFAVGSEDTNLTSTTNIEKLREAFTTMHPHQPSLVIILDQASILPMRLTLKEDNPEYIESFSIVVPHQSIVAPDENPTLHHCWTLVRPKSTETAATSHLALLLSVLCTHLESVTLRPPDMQHYLNKVVNLPREHILSIGPIYRAPIQVSAHESDKK